MSIVLAEKLDADAKTGALLTTAGKERSLSCKGRAAQTNLSSGDSERRTTSSNAGGFAASGV
jgi:hypothetical protein